MSKPAPRSTKPALKERPKREDLIRAAALECLGATLQERHLADRVLERVLRRETRLYSSERRAVAERVYGVLRRKATFDFCIDRALGAHAKGLSSSERDLLRLALCRLAEGEAVADIEATAGLKFDERAILKVWPDMPGIMAKLAPLQRLMVEGSLPEHIAKPLLQELSLQEALEFAASVNQRAPLTLRANALKTDRTKLMQSLRSEGMDSAPRPYSPWAVELRSHQNAFASAAFQRGDFEIQDEGSQLLALLVGAKPGERVVDACSGAGGKTLALAGMMENKGEIWALDVDERRMGEAVTRSRRAGATLIRKRLIAMDGAADVQLRDLHGKADRVLVDAPCSGLGALRRNPDARWRLRPDELPKFAATQLELLRRFAALVKPGGLLIYATCSILKLEDEEIAQAFLKGASDFQALPLKDLLPVPALNGGQYLRLWPQRHGTDGFFAAAFRRVS
jgi:16S rRNA (cytosine967-C5)-methyltransferase